MKPDIIQFPKDYSEKVIIPALKYTSKKMRIRNESISYELKDDDWYEFRIHPTEITFLYNWFHNTGLFYASTKAYKDEQKQKLHSFKVEPLL